MAVHDQPGSAEGVSRGFPPIAGEGVDVLVLGSLPGRRSIEAYEYYAHPRNAFWPIMEVLVGACGNYSDRCRQLVSSRIAVWDVLAGSIRPGSLDADIRMDSVIVNDFAGFFAAYPAIGCIAFNGKKAESLFMRRVLPGLGAMSSGLTFLSLPSTSPAHAGMSMEEKLEKWRRLTVR